MRLLLPLLFVVACESKAVSPAIPPPPPIASAAPSASMAAAEAGALEAKASLPLPSSNQLIAPFKGTNAHGFVAMTSMTARSFVSLREGVDAERPVLIASFTKLLTAVATLRMMERGEISLDETIKAALPDLASRPWADSTIRELLTHTSRVPEFDEKAGYYKRADVDLSAAANVVPVLLKNIPADWTEKRGAYKYRNSELAIVGAILAARAKTDAESVLRREVIDVAKMTHTGLFLGKKPQDLDLATMGTIRAQNFFTAGAGYSSANDLIAFFEALDAKDVLLKDESKKLLFEGSPDRNFGALACWAFPFAKSESGTTLLVERPGTFGNVRLFSAYFPEEHRAIIAWTDNVDIARPRASPKGIGAALARTALIE